MKENDAILGIERLIRAEQDAKMAVVVTPSIEDGMLMVFRVAPH